MGDVNVQEQIFRNLVESIFREKASLVYGDCEKHSALRHETR